MKKTIWSYFLVILMGFSVPSVVTALESDPQQVIASASEKLIIALKQERAHFQSNPQRLYNKVTNLMRPRSDFPSIARGVMGSFYKTATSDQKRRFAQVFEYSLVRIFSNSLMESETNEIKILPANNVNTASRKRKVSVVVSTADGSRFPVNYSMVRNKQNVWLIRNVILDGINLGLTYRNQFKSEMNRSGNNTNQVIANWSNIAKQ